MEKGNVIEAVRNYILSKNTEKACLVAVDIATGKKHIFFFSVK